MPTRGVKGYDAIVLAAGAARRYGSPKQLVDWRGEPLVLAAVDAALAAPVDRVIVVLGAHAPAVEAAIKTRACARLHWVVAADWQDGLSASLRAGIDRLPRESRGALIFLGDMPLIPLHLPWRVTAALSRGARAVQPLHAGAPAHPVGLSAALYYEVRGLTGDAGAGSLLRARRDVVRLACAEAGAVFDIDTASDLTAASPDHLLEQAESA